MMSMTVQGNLITINFEQNDPQPGVIQLPDGYSYENVLIITALNITFHRYMAVDSNCHLSFPPINSKSPCYLSPIISDTSKTATLRFLITKFGQIPDTHYFDTPFEPILVTGDDGNKYKVIPSDQFK